MLLVLELNKCAGLLELHSHSQVKARIKERVSGWWITGGGGEEEEGIG